MAALLLCQMTAGFAGGRLVRPVLLGESLTGAAQLNGAPEVYIQHFGIPPTRFGLFRM